MKVQSYPRAAAVIAAGTLALSACGGDAEPSGTTGGAGVSGTLNGGGSSAQEAAMEAWRAGFSEANPDATVNYDPAGSGSGREQFLSGGLAFAGSDAPLTQEERTQGKQRCAGGDAIEFPLYVSPVAVVYNLEGVEELKLSPAVIADIFNQKIKTWNDPAIAALNAGTSLPSTAITPVNRADSSGTTENFTDYLAEAAGKKWPYEPDGNFPVKGGEAAQGTSGVIAAVQAGNGAIGYADFSRAGELGVAKIQVGSEFVAPSPEGAAKAVEAAKRESGLPQGDITIEIPRAGTDPTAYPLTLVAYSIVCTAYQDAAQGELVKAFFTYAAGEEGQAAAAENAGSAPITETLRTDVQAAVQSIKAGA